MPSGAKKRKAAKKKMVEGSNNNSSPTHSHVLVNDQTMEGDDKPKHQPPFTEGGVENLEGRSPVRSKVSESKPHEESVDREVEPVEDFKGKIVSVDYEKESDDSCSSGSSSSSSSSSSDDESRVLEMVETAPPVDSNKQIDYVSDEVTQNADAISAVEVNHSVDSDKIAILDYAIESDDGSSDAESRALEKGKTVVETASLVENNYSNKSDNDVEEKKVEVEVEVETGPLVDSSKLANSLSEVVTQVSDAIPSEEFNHLVEKIDVASDKIVFVEYEKEPCVSSSSASSSRSSSNDESHVNGSASVVNPMTSCVVVESGLKENGEKKLLSLDESGEVPSIVMDLGSQTKEDEVVLSSDQYAKDSAAPINEDEISLSFNAPQIDTSNGEENVKSETHECSDSQPLVAPAPQTVQTTSWKSCCGIFELFTGTNR